MNKKTIKKSNINEAIPPKIIKGRSLLKVDEKNINVDSKNKNTIIYLITNSPRR
jgi:hypothetical protein